MINNSLRTILVLCLFVATGCDKIFPQTPAEYTDPTIQVVDDDDTPDPNLQDKDGDGVYASVDCDDEDPTVGGPRDWYRDADSDGWGSTDELVAQKSCDQPDGYVDSFNDCDDTNQLVYPDAPEICDGIDNDCNTIIDENTDNVWWLDRDGDGYGDLASPVTTTCDGSNGLVDNSDDCDDQNILVHPNGTEICNELDDNCNGIVDETTAVDALVWYQDLDGDGYGTEDSTTTSCTQVDGYSGNSYDCNDANDGINPDATEICDTIDNNCDDEVDEGVETEFYADLDGDTFGDAMNTSLACSVPVGYVVDNTDCDDASAAINPDATEVCDGEVDNDCNAVADDGDVGLDLTSAITWYADSDSDGFGDPLVTQVACLVPLAYVADNTDCDDSQPLSYPGNTEMCDTIDNDCDGFTDENDALDVATWYADLDGDSFGDPASSILACSQPIGYVADNTDCDDSAATSNPDATEMCDTFDNDCDGVIDEDDASDAPPWYQDLDGDLHGNTLVSTTACSQPIGYVDDQTDCDDSDSDVNPLGIEICNEEDDNCDGQIDEDVKLTFFADTDSDGFGDPGVTELGCAPSVGFVANDNDCDDTDGAVNPGVAEICNDQDDNCDGVTDEGVQITFFADSDGDTFGDVGSTTLACLVPVGYVVDNTDCDDTNGAINPDATEICDGGMDNNCDGQADDADVSVDLVASGITFFADTDGDTFGDAGNTTVACLVPVGYVVDNIDCDDTNGAINPDATEICDGGIDNDCDTLTDDADPSLDVATTSTWFEDSDADAFGDPLSSSSACAQPVGYVANNTDCDDNDNDINPGGVEVCNTEDDNCDGVIDEGVQTLFYQDVDSDTFGGNVVTTLACSVPVGYSVNNTDCDDTDGAINPDATEICDGGIDNDCDTLTDDADPSLDVATATTWYEDGDSDTYGDPLSSTTLCVQPVDYVANSLDCDDNDNDTNPDGIEVCNTEDDNCDGQVDEGVQTTFFADSDGDTFGNAGDTTLACSVPVGYSVNNTDCDDTNGAINPGATEICDGGIDNDCDTLADDADGSVDLVASGNTFYADTDGDTFGNAGSTTIACAAPVGFSADDTDCDDTNGAINPGATEICDGGIDNDCDALADDADDNTDEASMTPWYIDADGDGVGNTGLGSVLFCSQPVGRVSSAGDCNDSDAAIRPGATEICDTIDNDCDTLIDDADPGLDLGSALTFFADTDEDTFGDPGVIQAACLVPAGYVANSADCDDEDEFTSPDGIEVCSNGIDDDCDGESDLADLDGCIEDGSYTGDISILATDNFSGFADTCDGTITMTVDTTLSPMITGTGTCSFTGDFVAIFVGVQNIVLDGDVSGNLTADGEFDTDMFGESLDWTGLFPDSTSLDANLSGIGTEGGDTYICGGTFSTSLVP